jgi:methionine-rich copper-binding protein CopC
VSRVPRLIRHVLALVASCLVVLPASSTVFAHTELDFTLPAEGASVGEPVAEIRIGFTEPVTLVGPGFRVLTPQGVVIEPFAVTDDDKLFRLQLDPPLAGGAVGVQYEVAAADGHVLQGSFAFTVLADALPTTTPTTVPPNTQPATTEAASTTVASTTVERVASTTEAVILVAAAPTTAAETSVADTNDAIDDGRQSQRSLIIAIAAAVAAAGLGFVIVRSRRHPA